MAHRCVRRRLAQAALVLGLFGGAALAQPGGGPLPPPRSPPGNPITTAKANLGKALFWDEQLSSTRTVACGTCHMPEAGGSDFRKQASSPATNPGPDGVFGTADDIVGSIGVPMSGANGLYDFEPDFGLNAQVTGRDSRTVINAAYSPTLFWDGRATNSFVDPISGQVVLPNGAALESQAAGPPLSSAEMAHAGRDWNDVAARVAESRPLALSPFVPVALSSWIDGRDYPALFQEAFGASDVTPARIAMAMATYERTLFSNQTPLDSALAGVPSALTQQEQQGRNLFGVFGCAVCHAGNLLSDNQFHYIGVRPQNDDLGRFLVTNQNIDRGAFRTPTLRNVELTAPYFHNGRLETLEDVVDFYNRGGDFNAPNKPAIIRPLNMTLQQRNALLAFLRRPLTDPRVFAQQAPFDRPTLYAESDRVPSIEGVGIAAQGGAAPEIIAIEPPLVGNPSFTIAVWGGQPGQRAILVIDDAEPPLGASIPNIASVVRIAEATLEGDSSTGGYASASIALPEGESWEGVELFARWYIISDGSNAKRDPRGGLGADGGSVVGGPTLARASSDAFIAATPVARFTLFGPGGASSSALVSAKPGVKPIAARVGLAEFLEKFSAGDESADLAAPVGVLDGADIAAYLSRTR